MTSRLEKAKSWTKAGINTALKFAPLFNLSVTIFIPFIALYASVWIPEQAKSENGASSREVIASNLLNPRAPILWLLVSGILGAISSAEGYRNRYLYGSLLEAKRRFQADLQQRDQQLSRAVENTRLEAASHGESKESYHASLGLALQLLLTQPRFNFTDECRVTIFRKRAHADTLTRVFRYAQNRRYHEGISSRREIPCNEGIVGAAWNKRDTVCFRPERGRDIRSFLRRNQVSEPPQSLTMLSRTYWATVVPGDDANEIVAVVVYESTSTDALDFEKIQDFFKRNLVPMSKLIEPRSRLDEQFALVQSDPIVQSDEQGIGSDELPDDQLIADSEPEDGS